MGAALTYDDALNFGSADRTRFSCPVIHTKVILEFTAAIDPVDGCAVAADALTEDTADCFVQCVCLGSGNGVRGSQRIELGKVQRLIGVDIAQSRKKGLVQQQRLELAVFALQGSVKPLWCKSSAQRLWSKVAKYLSGIFRQPDAPKLTGIVEHEIAVAATGDVPGLA